MMVPMTYQKVRNSVDAVADFIDEVTAILWITFYIQLILWCPPILVVWLAPQASILEV